MIIMIMINIIKVIIVIMMIIIIIIIIFKTALIMTIENINIHKDNYKNNNNK